MSVNYEVQVKKQTRKQRPLKPINSLNSSLQLVDFIDAAASLRYL